MKKQDNNFWFNFMVIVWALFCTYVLWHYFFYIPMRNELMAQENRINNSFPIAEMRIRYPNNQPLPMIDFGYDIYKIPVHPISNEDREIIHGIVAGEAKYEPFLGKMAVAQCIKNAMFQDEISASEVQEKYQYSGWEPSLKYDDPETWNEICAAVSCVFDNGEIVTQDNILWFYNPQRSEGKFHNTQNFSLEISNHRFYSPKED